MNVKKRVTTSDSATSKPKPKPGLAKTKVPVRIGSLSPAEGRFECYWPTRKESNSAWPEEEDDCRRACEMSEAEVKWRADELAQPPWAAEPPKVPGKARGRTKRSHCVTPAEDPAPLEAKRQRTQDACNAWRIGEEIRVRRIWQEAAEDWALETIGKRRTRMEVTGFNLAGFLLPVSIDDSDALRHAKGWLPVYYEYVRQSPRWLQWARMLHTRERDILRKSQSAEFAARHLERTLGRGWIDAFSSLAPFLGEDVVFSEIPMPSRLAAAEVAACAITENIAIDAETWAVTDGGRPTCPPEEKWAGKRPLDVANQAQATGVARVNTFDSRTRKLETIEFRNALNATVEESFLKFTRSSEAGGPEEIEWRKHDDLSQRKIDHAGAEIIVLRVNWNHTSNQEIADAMKKLCEEIRPRHWPEFKELAGDKDQSAEKALKLLLYWRLKTAAGKDSMLRSLEEVRLKKDLAGQLKTLGIRRNFDKAAEWFRNITGDDQAPWWSESVTN